MYEFINIEKNIRKNFETRTELFAYMKCVCGPRGQFRSIKDMMQHIAMNDNDTYLDVEVKWAPILHVNKEHKKRTLMIKEDGRIIDIRPFQNEIEAADERDYHRDYKHRGVGHAMDGYTYDSYAATPKYVHILKEDSTLAELSKEYGLRPKPAAQKYNFRNGSWNYTRTWKNQTKSRKQWARHAKSPVGRFVRDRYPAEPEIVDEFDEFEV